MKTFFSIVILAIVILAIVMSIKIYKQNKEIGGIEKAEITESAEKTEVATGDSTITITKTSSGITQTGDMTIDEENTFLKFTGFGPGKEHEGSFDTMKADIIFDNGSMSGGKLIIEASSINTGIDGLDNHLKTDDFLDTEINPQIEFKLIDVVVKDEDQSATALGEITIKGITKNISVPLTILANGFSVDFLLDVSLFGISYIGVNNEVQIESQVIWK